MDRRGFVLAVVLFALLLMSAIAVAALTTSGDEHLSARAMRESSEAFYAAEAGANEVLADWPDSLAAALDPGDSLDLGWTDLGQGVSYRALIRRYDGGDQALYGLHVEGRGAGVRGGRRMLGYLLTSGPGRGLHLGGCCDAAVTVRGDAMFGEDDYAAPPFLNGHDHVPPGLEEHCPETLNDKTGLLLSDADDFNNYSPGGWVDGAPPIEERPALNDADWDHFGELTYDELKAMADYDLRGSSWDLEGTDNPISVDEIYPRYNADGSCDTSHPYNWGSSDPDDPCFTHHPIILVGRREQDIDAAPGYPNLTGYGQGIILLDWLEGTSNASEFDVENLEFNGLIIGRGCIEVQGNSMIRGAIFTDGAYNGGCKIANNEDAYKQENSGSVQYSQCAVDRAIYYAGLAEYAEAEFPGGAQRIKARAFAEEIR
ncbi:MAG: pilus assembly PilX N-terminal domain-containing protein [Gemmatimonadales bacterium]